MSAKRNMSEVTPIGVKVGSNLYELRIAAGMSQIDLAAAAGISPTTIGSLEKGEIDRPQTSTLKKIARALNIEMQDLTKGAYDNMSVETENPKTLDTLLKFMEKNQMLTDQLHRKQSELERANLQVDSLKKKNHFLESELESLHGQLASLKADFESLKK